LVLAAGLGFAANPAPVPQRVSDLVARLEALETTTNRQAQEISDLQSRVAALEDARAADLPIQPETAYARPDGWRMRQSSDGIVAYAYDPAWEISGDEPGELNFYIDDEVGLFLSWNWQDDLLDDLREDAEFLRIFEEDLLRGEGDTRFTLQATDEIDFLGKPARYWRLHTVGQAEYVAELLTVLYSCSTREVCSVMLIRLAGDAQSADADWEFLQTFAAQVEFLTTDKPTVNANANLRRCPSVECEIVGRMVLGEIVEVVGISQDGDWYRLRSGEWIAASLVEDAPSDLPVIDADAEI
jgi:hypothetical protein